VSHLSNGSYLLTASCPDSEANSHARRVFTGDFQSHFVVADRYWGATNTFGIPYHPLEDVVTYDYAGACPAGMTVKGAY
jgi:hypothetical protein